MKNTKDLIRDSWELFAISQRARIATKEAIAIAKLMETLKELRNQLPLALSRSVRKQLKESMSKKEAIVIKAEQDLLRIGKRNGIMEEA